MIYINRASYLVYHICCLSLMGDVWWASRHNDTRQKDPHAVSSLSSVHSHASSPHLLVADLSVMLLPGPWTTGEAIHPCPGGHTHPYSRSLISHSTLTRWSGLLLETLPTVNITASPLFFTLCRAVEQQQTIFGSLQLTLTHPRDRTQFFLSLNWSWGIPERP